MMTVEEGAPDPLFKKSLEGRIVAIAYVPSSDMGKGKACKEVSEFARTLINISLINNSQGAQTFYAGFPRRIGQKIVRSLLDVQGAYTVEVNPDDGVGIQKKYHAMFDLAAQSGRVTQNAVLDMWQFNTLKNEVIESLTYPVEFSKSIKGRIACVKESAGPIFHESLETTIVVERGGAKVAVRVPGELRNEKMLFPGQEIHISLNGTRLPGDPVQYALTSKITCFDNERTLCGSASFFQAYLPQLELSVPGRQVTRSHPSIGRSI